MSAPCSHVSLLVGVVASALLLHGTSSAQTRGTEEASQTLSSHKSQDLVSDRDESLASAVEVLTREWFEGQIGDLPPDELPEQGVIEADIAEMRDGTLRRVADVLKASDALINGRPNDVANSAAMVRLVEAFKGLERTTPIFTKLALSKVNDPAYRAGWKLCAIRVIAETWLPQAQEMPER